MPDDATLRAFYDSSAYFADADGTAGYSDYDSQTAKVLPYFHGLLDRLGPGNGRSVLDIGCAYGTHLAVAAQAGWQPYGVEVSEFARTVISKRYGDSVPVVSSISEVPARSWDLVVLFDVIEHLKDPYQVFIELIDKGAITPQTTVVITTPNARSSDALRDPAAWEYRTPPEHLVYFSTVSLVLLLTAVGFARVEISGIYRQDEPGTQAGAVENVDGFFEPYPGLSCVAADLQIPPTALISAVATSRERNREAAVQLRSSPFLGGILGAQARQADLRVDSLVSGLGAEQAEAVEGLRQEIEAFKRGRTYRLTNSLRSDQPLSAKVRESAWIVGSLVTPASIKRRVVPLVRPFRSSTVGLHDQAMPKPYVVRHPAAPRANRPRVVHAIANFMTGGSARLVVDLIEHLGDEYDQEVITSFVPPQPGYVGLSVREFRLLASPRPVLAYMRKFRPRLLHVHYWGDVDLPWYRQVFEAGKRYGCTIVENVNTPVAPFVADSVSRYVYVSDYVRQEFGRSVPNGQVIHPGSNLGLFAPPQGAAPADDCIGMVYRLEPDKLRQQAIDVFIKTIRRRPGTRALIVGGGSLQDSFQRTVAEAGLETAIEFTGYVRYEDLPSLYGRMSIFVAPVWKESFGQVTSFAMSMGLPVAGYNVGALGEIVSDRQLLAPAGDSAALAKILAGLLDNRERRAEIGERNVRRARELFSVDSMADQYRHLYRDVMSTAP